MRPCVEACAPRGSDMGLEHGEQTKADVRKPTRRDEAHFSGKRGRSIIEQDKGPHRLAARPGHKAPPGGAFPGRKSAPFFGVNEKFRTGQRCGNTQTLSAVGL